MLTKWTAWLFSAVAVSLAAYAQLGPGQQVTNGWHAAVDQVNQKSWHHAR
jgi:hypothetical protein